MRIINAIMWIMLLVFASLGVYLLAAAVFPLRGGGERPSRLAPALAAVAGLLGAAPAIFCLHHGASLEWAHAWGLPFGSFHLRLDPLSAWFALLLFVVAFLGAWHGGRQPASGGNWGGYFLLCFAMFLLLLAWDAVLFLVAWEVMSLAAWTLVMNHHDRPAARRAAWFYFIVTHASTVCLMLMFMLLARAGGGFSFDALTAARLSAGAAGAAFVLGVLGFGSKAGFFGMHLWMPEAYGAVTGHNAALLSAIMSKLSFYALLRLLGFLPRPEAWWGGALIALGALTAIYGIVCALMQGRLKRLLAYSSMENLGLLCLALGFFLFGEARGAGWGRLALLGLLLHVWHHGLCKTGLFLCSGSVAAVTGGAPIDSLGGLRRALPRTALAFAVCAAAICCLPPLSGFAGEYLMTLSALRGLAGGGASVATVIAALALGAALALAGGLAIFAMVKAYGAVFLGEAREAVPLRLERDHPLPALAAAALCLTLGLSWWLVLPFARPVVASVAGPGALAWGELQATQMQVAAFFALFVTATLIVWRWRDRRLAGAGVASGTTWACGYAAPNPRIQYTGASFAQPLREAFAGVLRPEACGGVDGYFPAGGAFAAQARDPVLRHGYRPAFHGLSRFFARLRVIQHGKAHLYIFYIIVALAAALAWALL